LTETQRDKLAKYSESVDFEDADTFADAVSTLTENFFGEGLKSQGGKVLSESEDHDLDANSEPLEEEDGGEKPKSTSPASVSRVADFITFQQRGA